MSVRSLALLMVFACAAPAAADGFYAAGRGGINWSETGDLDAPGLGEIEYANGYIVGGALGYAWSNGFRLEAEVMRRANDADTIGTPGARRDASGEVTSWAAMGNVLYDLKFGNFPLVPYVGVGAGAVRVQMDDVRAGGTLLADDHDTALGIQAIAGVSYLFTPRLHLTLDYRYMYANPSFSGPTSFDTDYTVHAVTAGIRIDF